MLALVPACVWTLDLDRPIALIASDSLSADDERDLKNAADCWNSEFGTRLVVGDDVATSQVVEVEKNEFACLINSGRGGGHFHARLEGKISLCPVELIRDIGFGSELQFGILLHELGHVANIFDHGELYGSVMSNAQHVSYPESSGEIAFSDEDRELFVDANPAALEPCARPTRLVYSDAAMACVICGSPPP